MLLRNKYEGINGNEFLLSYDLDRSYVSIVESHIQDDDCDKLMILQEKYE